MILHLEDPEGSTSKLLILKNKFCMIAGYKVNKVNLQNEIVFLYTNNEHARK